MPKALIKSVDQDSIAYEVGFEAGCYITGINGYPLRDIIDWMWYSSDDEITLEYIDLDSDTGSITLSRVDGEDWGINFDGIIYDGVKICKNNCKFCFMKQLPKGMRSSLTLRDDDFRLSFLTGTFVTLTNLVADDINRIVEQHISPLRVSLHAISPDIRKELIGRNHENGLIALEKLLDQGIEFDAQIVLCPGINDGEELNKTLKWAYGHPGIKNVGIVPLGFTSHQTNFDISFDDQAASKKVVEQVRTFQDRALREKGNPWVFPADEFYRNAYPDTLLDHLPKAEFYQGYPMFEDGIGIIRSSVDELIEALNDPYSQKIASACNESKTVFHQIAGEAMEPYTSQIISKSCLADCYNLLVVKNKYFGGNVNVTGLLTGQDIATAINTHITACVKNDSTDTQGHLVNHIYLLPDILFNADGLTLDGMSFEDLNAACDKKMIIVPSNPLDCIHQLISLI